MCWKNSRTAIKIARTTTRKRQLPDTTRKEDLIKSALRTTAVKKRSNPREAARD